MILNQGLNLGSNFSPFKSHHKASGNRPSSVYLGEHMISLAEAMNFQTPANQVTHCPMALVSVSDGLQQHLKE
jgi:hypothetical protein